MVHYYTLPVGEQPVVVAHTLIPDEQTEALSVVKAFADPEKRRADHFSEHGGWLIQAVNPELQPTDVAEVLESMAPEAEVVVVDPEEVDVDEKLRRLIGEELVEAALAPVETMKASDNDAGSALGPMPVPEAVTVVEGKNRPDWTWQHAAQPQPRIEALLNVG
jgi:hypothetical protein